jgi:agmatine deiminase
MPGPLWVQEENRRLPASYANFYIGNAVVLVPLYHHANDDVAMGILQEQFPKRKVTGIYCEDMVYGFGSIHCVTQQQP